MELFCCGCKKKIIARLTNGGEIYPHRSDLSGVRFWKCDICGGYVGVHKNSERYYPLGNIPTKELREKRKQIHAVLDPMWKSGKYRRKDLYNRLTEILGWEYHTAKIRSVEEAEKILSIITGKEKN